VWEWQFSIARYSGRSYEDHVKTCLEKITTESPNQKHCFGGTQIKIFLVEVKK